MSEPGIAKQAEAYAQAVKRLKLVISAGYSLMVTTSSKAITAPGSWRGRNYAVWIVDLRDLGIRLIPCASFKALKHALRTVRQGL